MAEAAPIYASLGEWVAREAISFDTADPQSFGTAVDRLMQHLGERVDLLSDDDALGNKMIGRGRT